MFGVNSQLTEEDVKSVNIVSNEEINEKKSEYVSLLRFMKKDWVVWGDEISLSANIIGEKHKQAKLIFEEIKNKSKVVISHPLIKSF